MQLFARNKSRALIGKHLNIKVNLDKSNSQGHKKFVRLIEVHIPGRIILFLNAPKVDTNPYPSNFFKFNQNTTIAR